MNNLVFKLIKSVSESYYDKLVTNMAKDIYFNDKEIYFDFYNNTIYSNDDILYEYDDILFKNLNNKLVNFLYEDLSKKNYKKALLLDNNYGSNKIILDKLIENKQYDVLYDILNNVNLFKDKNSFEKKDLHSLLKEKIFPHYNSFLGTMYNNYKNLDLLEKISATDISDFLKTNIVKKMYFENFFNTIYKYGEQLISYQKNEDVDKYQIYNQLLEENINLKHKFINKNDLSNYLYLAFDNYKENKVDSDSIFVKTKIHNQEVFLISLMNTIGWNKYEQYVVLNKRFSKDSSIFKTLMEDCANTKSFFNSSIYLNLNENSKIDITDLEEKKINLLEELINDVKKEQNPNNQHIMINKIKEHFNIHNDDFCLDNISNIQIKTIKEINDFTTETQFYNLFVSLDEERLDSFNNKFKSL